jgi:hypothetical protein
MQLRLFGLVLALVALPTTASADGTQQPKFPLGFDCSSVAAGSQRQACNKTHLDPPMGSIPEVKRTKPEGFIQQPQPPMVPTDKPATIPRLPGTIEPGN